MRRRMWWLIRWPTSTRGTAPPIDWEKTIAFRHYLWDLGLGVAEAMDTAQRGGGLGWTEAKELIGHALDAARTRPGVKICCGVGTDHLDPATNPGIDQIIRAYEEQIEAIEALGGKLVIMASRALARAAATPSDYAKVYGAHPAAGQRAGHHSLARRDVRSRRSPAIGARPIMRRRWRLCLDIIADNAAKIDGVKISLLVAGEGNRDAPQAARWACACIPATISTTPN